MLEFAVKKSVLAERFAERTKKEGRKEAMDRPRLDLSSSRSLLKQSSRSFLSNFFVFLFVSLAFFSFKVALERGTLLLSSFLEQQTSFHSPFPSDSDSSKTYSGGDRRESTGQRAGAAHRSFVIFTMGGTLDDDFFADELLDGRNREREKAFGSSEGFDSPNITRFLGRALPGNPEGFLHRKALEDDVIAFVDSGSVVLIRDLIGGEDDRSNGTRSAFLESNRPRRIRFYDHQGFPLDRADAAFLIFLIVGMSAAFGWLLLGYLLLYSCSYGVVFFAVVSGYLGKRNSIFTSLRVGCRSGIHRLTVFMLLRWAFREVLLQFLSLVFFSSVRDEYTLVKLMMRLKLMPFSVAIPLTKEMTKGGDLALRIWGFLLSWFLLEAAISFVQNLDCWVALSETRISVLNAVIKGFQLNSVMWKKAFHIKILEVLFCGLRTRLLLAKIGGDLFAMFLQSMAQTYFLVAWLVFYFAAMTKGSHVNASRQWGYNDLEDCLEVLR